MISEEEIRSIEYEAKEYAAKRASMNPYQWNQWILQLITEVRNSRKQNEVLREGLEFYSDADHFQQIWDDADNPKELLLFERYEKFSIGDLGVKAKASLAEADRIGGK